jgi:three-Cys-motif partner protein
MTAPKGVKWPVAPHTLAKHQILARYLDQWWPTLSFGHHPRVVFFDGFAGPGEYSGGEEGSPIVALRSLVGHSSFPKMTKTEFIFVFFEKNKERLKHLEEVAIPRLGALPRNIEIVPVSTRFREALNEVLDRVDGVDGVLAPSFAFIDPFGFSHTPMATVARLLSHLRSEVLITVMLDRVRQFAEHPSDRVRKQMDELFGDVGYRVLLKNDDVKRLDVLGDFYAAQLRKHAEYVCSFRMINQQGRPIYDLFFATHHIAGLKKMKRAMWKVDPGGGRRFSDRRANILTLFEDEPDTTSLQVALVAQYKGRDVGYAELEEWVLVNTAFHDGHIKKRTLVPLEDRGKVTCVPARGTKRRAHTFPTGCTIRFA